ncbi:dicarboxylate transporter/tellurite-resistance protein TehA [Neorhizobium sp. P12A]|uniref:dicarboxylate transporter/tellurite-resistance protein TehA n=1 Tax=Neorhizobium sp. P12A TaxID=2268027 RepID=UPI0011EBCC27|nr:dicarboxylate transporter/tellurite-resistance protein TehA [Neorhizobium sp. P12A]KAA0697459.1 dicarboxylate transporter/tellurite-resistance protein TehA [Neorhizobium sp. P12A]
MSAVKVPLVPAAFFGMVLGLAGLGTAWRLAHQVWHLPALIGEIITFVAIAVWALLIILFALKWLVAREEALKEVVHPVQCCFIGLVGVATMLAAGGLLPYSHGGAEVLFGLGALYTLLFAVWRTGGLWQGDRQDAMTTPVLYLPAVAGSFVTAIIAGAIGHPDWGQYAFGAGIFTWLAIESVLLHRFYTVALPPPMRPTLGVQLAPAPVGAVAYLSVTQGPPDIIVHAMVGYAVLQALILLRLYPWIRQEPFAPSYWAFTFGATALASAPLRLIDRGDTGLITVLAPVLFVVANIVVGLIAIGTIHLVVTGRMPVTWAALSQRNRDAVGQG